MKIRDKIFKYFLITNIIVVAFFLIFTLSLLFIFINSSKNREVFLLNKNFENYLTLNISGTEALMEEISSSNDMVFLSDKNKLIRNYAEKIFKKKFTQLVLKNEILTEVKIRENNQINIVSGGKETYRNKEVIFIYEKTLFVNLIKNIDQTRELIIILNLSELFQNYIKSINLSKDKMFITNFEETLFITDIYNSKMLEKTFLKKYIIINEAKFGVSFFEDGYFYITESKKSAYKYMYTAIIIFILLFIFILVLLFNISKHITKKTTYSILEIVKIIKKHKIHSFHQIEIKEEYEDEVKLLANNFNYIGEELKNHIDNLEFLVQKRTEKIENQKKELKVLNNQLQNASLTDELTQLKNRRHFNDNFKNDFKLALREKMYLHFAIIDIDFFKNINDTYGHLAGDFCLKELGNLLQENLKRNIDNISRYGGEEFVFYYFSKSEEDFVIILEKLRRKVENNDFIYNNTNIKFTISIGAISKIPKTDYSSPEEYIKKADESLYISKDTGRNKITLIRN